MNKAVTFSFIESMYVDENGGRINSNDSIRNDRSFKNDETLCRKEETFYLMKDDCIEYKIKHAVEQKCFTSPSSCVPITRDGSRDEHVIH